MIDTGALLQSADVTVEIDLNVSTFMSSNYTFTVKIFAEPYYVYLDERFQLTNDLVNSRSFRNTTDRLRLYFAAYLTNQYPLLRFDNITLELSEVIIVNQP